MAEEAEKSREITLAPRPIWSPHRGMMACRELRNTWAATATSPAVARVRRCSRSTAFIVTRSARSVTGRGPWERVIASVTEAATASRACTRKGPPSPKGITTTAPISGPRNWPMRLTPPIIDITRPRCPIGEDSVA